MQASIFLSAQRRRVRNVTNTREASISKKKVDLLPNDSAAHQTKPSEHEALVYCQSMLATVYDLRSHPIDVLKIPKEVGTLLLTCSDQICASVPQQLTKSDFIRCGLVAEEDFQNYHCLNVFQKFVVTDVAVEQPLRGEYEGICF